MTQRALYTKDMIVDAAFELTRRKGWQAVSARGIARALTSSTMPIYSSLRSMVDIEQEVRARTEKLLLEYQQKPLTGSPALDSAFGYVAFARDEPRLFRFLYTDRPVRPGSRPAKKRARVSPADVSSGKAVSLRDQAAVAMQDQRILKAWIFVHGLASLVSSGVLDLTDSRIRSLLLDAGGAFYGGGK